MKILGLDHGTKRIGVAVSDDLGITARGLSTIERKGLERDILVIVDLVRELGVEKIILGYPITLSGEEGMACERVRKFAGVLESRLDIPVILWDETLSTVEAESILRESAVKRKKRKKFIDSLAAAIILQAYLDHSASGASS